MKITFFLPTITHPRFQKRIDSLANGNELKIYAFDRGLYKKNSMSNVDITIIGQMSNKNYGKRIFQYFKLIRILLKSKKETNLFYFFTLDVAFFGFLFLRRNSYIYEIGDFAYLTLPKLAVSMLTFFDLKIIKNSYKTVLTSDGFTRYLLQKDNQLSNLIVIPNKPVQEILSFPRKTQLIDDQNKLRFGFVGILRYPDTVFKFIKIIADKFPNFEFKFYGVGGLTEEFIELSKEHSNLCYKGEFKNPADLEKIYYDFDIHVACYDIKGLNQRLAEPNKLYESIYFGNPIIATKSSFFGETVESNKIGYVTDSFSEENIISLLKSLKLESLNECRRNMLNITPENLIYSDKMLLEVIDNFK